MDHSSPQNDFGNAKSQAAKKALLAGHVTFSKELCQFNSTQYHNNGTQGPLQKSNHVRRIYFSTIFHWTLLARGPDSAARPDYFETMHSISVIYALNCRSRKRSFGGKFFWLNKKRELKQIRRRPQRRLQKNNSFNDQNNSSARASRFLVHFLDVHCTITTWNLLICRFMEDVNDTTTNFPSCFWTWITYWASPNRRD